MEDDLSPTSEPEAEHPLRYWSPIVHLSTKKLGERCLSGQLRARKARPQPNEPLQWLTTETALREAGILGTSADLAPPRFIPPEAAPLRPTFPEPAVTALLDLLECILTDLKGAGRSDLALELLARETERREAAEREVAELRAELQRPPRFRDWFLGRRRP